MSIRLIKKLILVSGLLSACFSINQNTDFILLPCLPLLYGLLYYFLVPSDRNIGAGFATLTAVLYVRYIIYPVSLKLSGYDILGDPRLAKYAILLMLYEMIVIMITLWAYSRKQSNVLRTAIVPKGISPVIPVFFAVIMIYIVVFQSDVYVNRRWIWQSGMINQETVSVNGLFLELAKWGEFFIIIYLFYKLYTKYLKTRRRVYYLISLVILFLPCLTFTGHSRLSLLIPLISYVFFIIKVYPQNSKAAIRFVSVYTLLAMLFLTIQKTFGDTSLTEIETESQAQILNSYFGGIDNVILGIEAYESYGRSMYYWLVDTFRNMMGVSKYLEGLPSTLDFFNMSYYKYMPGYSSDQIPPTVTQGLMYFGPFFCFIPTVIMTLCVCVADDIYFRTSDLMVAYLCLGFCIAVAWALPGSYMHLTTRIFNYLLPLVVLVYINKKLRVRVR